MSKLGDALKKIAKGPPPDSALALAFKGRKQARTNPTLRKIDDAFSSFAKAATKVVIGVAVTKGADKAAAKAGSTEAAKKAKDAAQEAQNKVNMATTVPGNTGISGGLTGIKNQVNNLFSGLKSAAPLTQAASNFSASYDATTGSIQVQNTQNQPKPWYTVFIPFLPIAVVGLILYGLYTIFSKKKRR